MAEQRNPGPRSQQSPGSQQQAGSIPQRKSGNPLAERRRMRHESRTAQTYTACFKYLRDVGQFPSEQAAQAAATSRTRSAAPWL